MFYSRRRVALVLAILASLLGPVTAGSQQQGEPFSRLFKDSRQLLGIWRAQGRSEASLLVAARPGRAADVARHAEGLGGTVRYRADDVDYLRVRLPIERASVFAEHESIEAIAADIANSDPFRLSPSPGAAGGPQAAPVSSSSTMLAAAPASRQTAQETWPPRWSDYPLRNPYSPIGDIGAADLLAAHPTYDGRGVTIALLDGNMDMLLPEFQTGTTLDGRSVPKFVDYFTVTDPREDAADNPQWVDMGQQVTATGGTATFAGKNFRVPADGSYRAGIFSERRFNDPSNAAYLDQDIDRNGNPRGDDGQFGVLWNEASNDVWVDTDRDLDFRDELAMTDYRNRPQFGVFGKDDPDTNMRDAIGFAVQTDSDNKFVAINVGIYQHATEIMGHVVGNKEPAGRLQGVAPGARLVSIFYGGTNAHGLIEGLIAAFRHPDTDLIVLEQSVAIASGPYLLADGRHPLSIIGQRLTERYDKLFFVPGSNAPGFGYVAEDGLAPGAVSVGGYQSQESYRMNGGFIPEPYDNLHWGALSHGPSGNGGLKPDLLAPSGQMSTDLGYVYRPEMQHIRGLFQMPPGYAVDGGTSTATPMAAGATALVVSAAKQSGITYDARSLKAAITGSARFIPRLMPYEQGNGLIQVQAAYELLRRYQQTGPIEILARAPVRTRLSHLFATPHEGVGLYEREGWAVGDRDSRTITLTRTSGPSGAMSFAATWLGNDGTFSSAPTVVLPLGDPVAYRVDIAVETAGAHTATLNLATDDVPGPAFRMMAAVIAPLKFSADDKQTVTAEITVPRPGDRPVFVEVPAGVRALQVTLSGDDGLARLTAISPSRDYRYACPWTGPPGPCAVDDPEPGVWEITATVNGDPRNFDPDREQPVKPVPMTVTATLLGVSMTVPQTELAGAAGVVDFPVSLSNALGTIGNAAVSAGLGSARRVHARLAQGEQHSYELTVPPGAGWLRVRVGDLTDPAADLDLYLMDCTTDDQPPAPAEPEKDEGNKVPSIPPARCPVKAKMATPAPGGEIMIEKPASGRWVVVVDGYSVPSGGTEYAYRDAFTHPDFGAIAVAGTPGTLAAGQTWSSTAHAWVAKRPEDGRELHGLVLITGAGITSFSGAALPVGVSDIDLRGLAPR